MTAFFTQARTAVAAVVALVTAIVTLLFQLMPWLKPDPRDRVGADVSVFALERNVTIGEWIARAVPPADQAKLRKSHPDRAAEGEVLYVRAAVDGHKHRKVRLRVEVLRRRTEKLVPPSEIDAPPIGAVKMSAPDERSVQAIWVPDLTHEPAGLFFRGGLWEEHGMLAIADSPPLRKGRFAVPPAPRG